MTASDPAERDAPGVIAPPPLIFLTGLAAGFALDAALPTTAPVPAAVRRGVGGGLIVGGGTLLASFLGAFRRKGTAVNPGSPTTAIVSTGPYRISRNPAYLGMALVYTGIAVASEALWALVPLAPVVLVVNRGVIAREERYLERKFGDTYLDYKSSVRRWV